MPMQKTLFATLEISLENRAASQSPMNAIDSFIGTQPKGSFTTFQYRENKSNAAKPYWLVVQINIVVVERADAADEFKTFVNSALFESGAVVDFEFQYKEKEVAAPAAPPEE